jgi:hypothetical protein
MNNRIDSSNESKGNRTIGMLPRTPSAVGNAENPVVMFAFRPETTVAEQNGILERIKHWLGVTSVSRLSPEARRPDMLRFAYVRLAADIQPNTVLNQLRGLPEVQEAQEPAERHSLR